MASAGHHPQPAAAGRGGDRGRWAAVLLASTFVAIAGPTHLFRLDGGMLVPSDLVRGPWDHQALHGGAVCGALAWAAQQADIGADAEADHAAEPARAGFRLCRLTTEILRPVPLTGLGHRAEVVHDGRRSRVVTSELLVGERVVARASSQWLAANRAEPAATTGVEPADLAVPRRPTEATDPDDGDIAYPRPGFNCDVFELRPLVGSTEEPGPGVVWARMRVGLVEGVDHHPVHLLATVSDLANAVGWTPSPNDAPMINPDLTLQIVRYPVGDWVCIEAATTATSDGIGFMDATLWDGDGRFARVLSTTVESPVALAVDR